MMEPLGISCLVQARLVETLDVTSFQLLPLVVDVPALSPGAHLRLITPAGIERAYSIVNSPEETDSLWVCVKREPHSRGGSASMHDLAVEGTVLSVTAMANNFPPLRSERKAVLVAGGIGVTPILASAQALRSQAISTFEIHYFARSRAHIPLSRRLRTVDAYLCNHLGLNIKQSKERLQEIISSTLPNETDIYACGPGAMITTVASAALRHGISDEAIRFEYFGDGDLVNRWSDAVQHPAGQLPHVKRRHAKTSKD